MKNIAQALKKYFFVFWNYDFLNILDLFGFLKQSLKKFLFFVSFFEAFLYRYHEA